jgi:hypothetical protein
VLTPAALQALALSAGFWVAFALHRRTGSGRPSQRRFLAGLVLGALAAHLGWALLHADRIVASPDALLRSGGWSVLFVPFGVLLAAPWGGTPGLRARYFRSAASSLPLALATARLGCLAVGCCHGTATSLPWGVRLAADATARHPTAFLDIAGLVALHGLTGHFRPQRRVAVAIGGFGLLRLAIEPWRAAPPLGPPWLDARWIAALWVGVAAALLLRARGTTRRCEREGRRGPEGVLLADGRLPGCARRDPSTAP